MGLPLALVLAKKFKVIGFDISESRIQKMKDHIDPSRELGQADFEGADIEFSADLKDLARASFYIVAVPTPVDEHKVPDLKPILGATSSVAKILTMDFPICSQIFRKSLDGRVAACVSMGTHLILSHFL